MIIRELDLQEFSKLVTNRYKLGVDATRRLKAEFDAANATYQMVNKNASHALAGNNPLSKFIADIEGTLPDTTNGAPVIMGAESLYGALFIHSKLCVTEPASHCVPASNDYEDVMAAKYGTLFIEHITNKLNLADKIERTLYLDTSIFGNGIAFVGWNPNKGTVKRFEPETKEVTMSGDFEFRRVSPYSFLPQPDCIELSECDWCFERHEITLEELCYTYPDKAEFIRDFHKQSQSDKRSWNSTSKATTEEAETVTVLEYWERALPWNAMNGRHAVFLSRDEGDNKEPVMKCILIENNPYQHGCLPFVMLSDIDIAGSLWGIGRLTICQPIQEIIDRVLSIVYDNSELHGQIHLVVPDGTHNPDNLRTDDPTHVYKFNAAMANGQKPMQMQPSMVSSDFWRQYDLYKDQINSIFGAGEFSQGEINRELSGFAVLTAIDADDKFRVRLFNKKVQMLKDLYTKLLSVGQQYLDEADTIRVVGQERMATAQTFKVCDLKGNYDVHVGFGRLMPNDPSAQKEYLLQLLQTGLLQEAEIDPKKLSALLIDGNLMDFGNHIDGAKRVQENEIVKMLAGEQCPVYEYMEHTAHLEVLNEFMNTVFFESLPAEVKEVFEAHSKAHVDIFAELTAQANAGAEEPPMEGEEPPAQ